MSFNLVLQAEALLDIQEAFEWYEKQRSGLGHEFIEEVETGFERIISHPLYYTAINERYRRIKINRFPYLIVYEIEASQIIVNSVRHTRRKPKY